MREIRYLRAEQVIALDPDPTLEEVDSWVRAQMGGDWFTSNLLRLMSKADTDNKKKLALGFPDEYFIWLWWYQREEPDEEFWVEGSGSDTTISWGNNAFQG
jgi:hypothetical protein